MRKAILETPIQGIRNLAGSAYNKVAEHHVAVGAVMGILPGVMCAVSGAYDYYSNPYSNPYTNPYSPANPLSTYYPGSPMNIILDPYNMWHTNTYAQSPSGATEAFLALALAAGVKSGRVRNLVKKLKKNKE